MRLCVSTLTYKSIQDNMFQVEAVYDREDGKIKDICIHLNDDMYYMDEDNVKTHPHVTIRTFNCDIGDDVYIFKIIDGKTDTAELYEMVLFKNKIALKEDEDYYIEMSKAAYFDNDSDSDSESDSE